MCDKTGEIKAILLYTGAFIRLQISMPMACLLDAVAETVVFDVADLAYKIPRLLIQERAARNLSTLQAVSSMKI